jgi:hypothetical protein
VILVILLSLFYLARVVNQLALRTGLERLTTPTINTYHVPKCCTEMKENEMGGTR